MEHHTVYLIHPLEVSDPAPEYVDGYNDQSQAVRLCFEVGKGSWQPEEARSALVYANTDTRISIPMRNIAMVEVSED